jgi:photosystem I subunit 3
MQPHCQCLITPAPPPPLTPQIPTIGFLYVAGWIGYVGRQYLNLVKGESKPTEKEIIIDVPAALKLSAEGFGWPLRVVNELRAGTLTEKAENITVSPR